MIRNIITNKHNESANLMIAQKYPIHTHIHNLTDCVFILTIHHNCTIMSLRWHNTIVHQLTHALCIVLHGHDIIITHYKGRPQRESLTIVYFLYTYVTGLVVGYVLISNSPSHVHNLKLQVVGLTVRSKQGEGFLHELISLVYEVYTKIQKNE